ncbi:MAG: hypothetical protein HZB26_10775 [Candidatus Hydrogenedentes bacterium]|nr:hypothetical protein [Candidatus Hydrogenedentota bacterium]
MKTKTWADPVVQEVRGWRDALFREAGYDLKRFGARVMQDQERHGVKLVQRPPKKQIE